MAIESIHIPLGSTMPGFELLDPSGKKFTSRELMGARGLLVVFTCNHCPYAKAVWPRIIAIAGRARSGGINTVAINPNIHPEFPDDAPDVMAKRVREWGIPFPYLVDESQDTARAYGAQCTPDIYLYDSRGLLVYHGRVDDNWQDASRVTKHELMDAVENLVAGIPIASTQTPSIGCSIKWRKQNRE